MIVAESLRTRRLVGRLDRGADLLAQLVAVCRTHNVRAGTLRAVGALEDAVVGEWDQAGRKAAPPRRFDCAFEILSLTGTIAEQAGAPMLSAFVSLSRARDNGIELIGGRLVAGRVYACEFVIEAFDDVSTPATLDASTGLSLWAPVSASAPATAAAPVAAAPIRPVAPAPSAAPTPPLRPVAPTPHAPTAAPTPMVPAVAAARAPEPDPEPEADETAPSFEAPARTSWQEVVAASERRAEQAATEEKDEADDPAPLPSGAPTGEVLIRAGDLIDHPKFGRVQVERVDGDQEYVSARLRNQRLIRLSLEVLTLVPAGQADGKNVFRAITGNLR